MKTISLILLCLIGCAHAQEDRSFYQQPDKSDWPGDTLSERQVLSAIKHFHNPRACSEPWKWALIGPNIFLLEGTDYVLTRVSGSEFEPNLHYSKGYWGGVILNTLSVPVAKLAVEYQAEGDCKYGDGK